MDIALLDVALPLGSNAGSTFNTFPNAPDVVTIVSAETVR